MRACRRSGCGLTGWQPSRCVGGAADDSTRSRLRSPSIKATGTSWRCWVKAPTGYPTSELREVRQFSATLEGKRSGSRKSIQASAPRSCAVTWRSPAVPALTFQSIAEPLWPSSSGLREHTPFSASGQSRTSGRVLGRLARPYLCDQALHVGAAVDHAPLGGLPVLSRRTHGSG